MTFKTSQLLKCSAVFLLFVALAIAQTASTGGLTGTVTDSTGSVVPNVTVTAVSAGTGQERTAMTDAAGTYRFALLPPGAYRVRFSASGFKTSEVSAVQVVVTETPVVDRTLEVGSQAEQVTVEASVETIQTTNSTLGTTVGASTVTSLPLTTRNYTQILSFSAGVNVAVNNAALIGNGAVDVAVNGARPAQNNFLMDGVVVTPFGGGAPGSAFYSGIGTPNPDAIAEFKIQTSQYDAGYGRNIGANVNVITKSGTNAFHGSVFEFFRNTALNANDFFRNRYCAQTFATCGSGVKPQLNQNQFGGVLGGALKKDKLFFFLSYQGTRQKNGLAAQGLSTVNLPLVPGDRTNKASLRSALGAAYAGRAGALGGVTIAPDGSNINDVALNILMLKLNDGSYYLPGSSTGALVQSGVALSRPAWFNENQVMINGDYLLSAKHTIATRYYYQPQDQYNSFVAAGQALGTPQNLAYGNHNAVLKLTSLISNTMVNEVYGSFMRTVSNIYAAPTADGTNPITASSVGIRPLNAHTDILQPMFLLGLYNAGSTCCNTSWQALNESQVGDQLSWTKGSHSIRGGGAFHHVQWPWTFAGFARGEQTFRSFSDFLLGKAGCTPGDSTCNTGNPGNTNGTAFSNIFSCTQCMVTPPGGVVHYFQANNFNLFLQDDWKVNSRLTVNAGVRWEYIGQVTDKYGNLTNTWLDRAIAGNALVGSDQASGTYKGYVVANNYQNVPLTGQLSTIEVSPRLNSAQNGSKLNNFAPRIGFAWTPMGGNKLVVRGGVGIFFDTPNGNSRIHAITENPPYVVKVDAAAQDNVLATLAAPFNYRPLGWGPSRFVNLQTGVTSGITTFTQDHVETPTVYQYNLNMQYEVLPTLVLEVGYVGSKGVRLINSLRQINTASLASPQNPVCVTAASGLNCVTNNTNANLNARVPFLGYSSVGLQQEGYIGDSRFNSLQITLRKRMSNGLTFQAAYTLSSLFTNLAVAGGTSAISNSNNPMDLRQQWGRSVQYRPNRLAINYSWDIPTGNLGGNSILSKVLKGWSLSGVTTIQDGLPMSVIDNRGGTVFSAVTAFAAPINPRAQMALGATYADVATSGSDNARVGLDAGSTRYLNAAAFVAPPVAPNLGPNSGNPTLYGNSGVGIVQGPGQLNFDASFIKNTKVGGINENASLQFRAEFYNLFNHTQFSNPALRLDLGSFGQISSTSVAPRLIQFALKYSF